MLTQSFYTLMLFQYNSILITVITSCSILIISPHIPNTGNSVATQTGHHASTYRTTEANCGRVDWTTLWGVGTFRETTNKFVSTISLHRYSVWAAALLRTGLPSGLFWINIPIINGLLLYILLFSFIFHCSMENSTIEVLNDTQQPHLAENYRMNLHQSCVLSLKFANSGKFQIFNKIF